MSASNPTQKSQPVTTQLAEPIHKQPEKIAAVAVAPPIPAPISAPAPAQVEVVVAPPPPASAPIEVVVAPPTPASAQVEVVVAPPTPAPAQVEVVVAPPAPAPAQVQVVVAPPTPAPAPVEVAVEPPTPAPAQVEVAVATPAPVVSRIRATSETATTTPVSREAGAFGRQNLVLERARNNPAEIVFIGDSITEGWEGAPEQWKMLIGSHSAINLGVGGDRTQHVLWRLEQAPLSALNPKLVVVMIGTNNIYDDNCPDILAGIHDVANLIHQQCPNAEVLVLDIPPRGDLKDSAREKIAQINIGLTLGMWPKHARFVRVGKQFLKPDGSIDPADMPDLLHFSQKGYAMWAASMKPELDCSLEANHPLPAPTMAHP